tara:strand:+ start:264 stop:422 length:159 start_codon:yes stop_codon:yes gene_type:complete
MIKPVWDKEEGVYKVVAFGEVQTFSSSIEAWDYANEVNDYWMEEYKYLDNLI